MLLRPDSQECQGCAKLCNTQSFYTFQGSFRKVILCDTQTKEYQDRHRSLEEAHSSEGSPASWSVLWALTLLPSPSVPFWEKSLQLSLFVGRRMSMWASYKQLFVSMLPVESERSCHEEQPLQLFPQGDNLGQISPFSSIIRTSLEGIWLLGAGKHLGYK